MNKLFLAVAVIVIGVVAIMAQTTGEQTWQGEQTYAARVTHQAGVFFASKTMANFDALVPTAIGEVFYCSNCTVKNTCISTGTAVAQWMRMDLSTKGCGTGE